MIFRRNDVKKITDATRYHLIVCTVLFNRIYRKYKTNKQIPPNFFIIFKITKFVEI